MTVKEARTALRASLRALRQRIRFPKIRIREVLESEDLVSIVKEYTQNAIMSRFARRQ